jgi:hypothetical protein
MLWCIQCVQWLPVDYGHPVVAISVNGQVAVQDSTPRVCSVAVCTVSLCLLNAKGCSIDVHAIVSRWALLCKCKDCRGTWAVACKHCEGSACLVLHSERL